MTENELSEDDLETVLIGHRGKAKDTSDINIRTASTNIPMSVYNISKHAPKQGIINYIRKIANINVSVLR